MPISTYLGTKRNDAFTVDFKNDVYIKSSKGNDVLVINNGNIKNVSELKFTQGKETIYDGDTSKTVDSKDLVISYTDSNKVEHTVTIENYFASASATSTKSSIQSIRLNDSSDLLKISDYIAGMNISTYAKKINGTVFNDTIDLSGAAETAKHDGARINAGAGNDNITGSINNDIITGGTGVNTLHLYKTTIGGEEIVDFGNDVVYLTNGETLNLDFGSYDISTLKYEKVGRDLKITTADNKSSLTLKNFAEKELGATVNIGKIITTGTGEEVFSGSEVADYLTSISVSGKGKINGTKWDDVITGSAKKDTIYAGDGNDTISAGAGSDRIYLANGTKTISISTGDGNDIIYDANKTTSTNIVFKDIDTSKGDEITYNGNGRDLIITRVDADGKEVANKKIKNLYVDGEGHLTTSKTSDRVGNYLFKLTDGTYSTKQHVYDEDSKTWYLLSGSSITKVTNVAEDLSGKTWFNNNGVITLDSTHTEALTETTTVKDYFVNGGTVNVNGKSVDDGNNMAYNGSSKADKVLLGSGNDTVFAGAGNDTISAGAGDNTIYVNGKGTKTIVITEEDMIDAGANNEIKITDKKAVTNLVLTSAGVADEDTASALIYTKDGNDLVVSAPSGFGVSKTVPGVIRLVDYFLAGSNQKISINGQSIMEQSIIANVTEGTNNFATNNGDDIITITGGTNTVSIGAGDDNVKIYGGNNTIVSSAGNDTYTIIGAANNTITDTDGKNNLTIMGTLSNRDTQTVQYASGTTTVKTGAGDDTFVIQAGNYLLNVTTGDGADVIDFSKGGFEDFWYKAGGYTSSGEMVNVTDFSKDDTVVVSAYHKGQLDKFGTVPFTDMDNMSYNMYYNVVENSDGTYSADFSKVTISSDKIDQYEKWGSFKTGITLNSAVKGGNVFDGNFAYVDSDNKRQAFTFNTDRIDAVTTQVGNWLQATGYKSVDAALSAGEYSVLSAFQYAAGGTDSLVLSSKADSMTIESGENSIDFGAGNDTINITGGINEIIAGAGDDTIYIENPYTERGVEPPVGFVWGESTINGGDGDDTFTFGRGSYDAFVKGGAGADTFNLADATYDKWFADEKKIKYGASVVIEDLDKDDTIIFSEYQARMFSADGVKVNDDKVDPCAKFSMFFNIEKDTNGEWTADLSQVMFSLKDKSSVASRYDSETDMLKTSFVLQTAEEGGNALTTGKVMVGDTQYRFNTDAVSKIVESVTAWLGDKYDSVYEALDAKDYGVLEAFVGAVKPYDGEYGVTGGPAILEKVV